MKHDEELITRLLITGVGSRKTMAYAMKRYAEHMIELHNNPPPVRLSCHFMNDNHTFREYNPASVNDLVEAWIVHTYDNPHSSLCPVCLIDHNGEEVRRVGVMVNDPKDIGAITVFIKALESDDDVMRLIGKDGYL